MNAALRRGKTNGVLVNLVLKASYGVFIVIYAGMNLITILR